MEKTKFDARAIAGMSVLLTIGMSLPHLEMTLDAINEIICEIRTEITSGEKSQNEINTLFDRLQEFTLKKYHVETRIGQIKLMHKVIDDRKDNNIKKLGDDLIAKSMKYLPEEL
jgi:hypothetical protein